MVNKLYVVFLLVFSLFSSSAVIEGKTVQATDSMVVTRHYLASRIGNDVLRAGGNAIDASVAVSFALSVVLPQASPLGG